ncbi:hypothetical protein [Arthrobacter sp. 92]|uniref:hypothetical protein n=1 Tax=Arthrobacter sp. 92 TaxID=3418175 RepID=UPI003D045CAE
MSPDQPATFPIPADVSARSPLEERLDPPVRRLAVGVWTAELVGDELADISYAGRPVLRAIKAVVRDHEWRTLAPSVRDFTELKDDDGLSFRFHVDYAAPDAVEPAYEGMVTFRITPATVEMNFSGRAITAFRRNRIGIVVLHPASEAGRDVSVVAQDGTLTTGTFPREISPDLVFRDISSMEWADAGTAFDLGFTGDIFETEDQRNWSDGSFKTYSTPSALPIPVDVAPGDTVQQSVSLEALSIETPDNPLSEIHAKDAFAVAGPAGTVPPLALLMGASDSGNAPEDATGAAVSPGSAVLPGLDAVLLELFEPREEWPARLTAAAREADRHGAGLDVRIISTAADEVPEILARALGGTLSRISRLGIFDPGTQCTDPAVWAGLTGALKGTDFGGQLVAGTCSHFTELNRWISADPAVVPRDADALAYSLSPQVHSTEIGHVLETLPIQRLTALNALRLGGGRPVHVGPVTLKPRFHAPGHQGAHDELQGHSFTAAWTLGSIAALTVDGVASVTYFETSPPRGITADDGALTPAGELLQRLAAHRGRKVLTVTEARSGKSPLTLYPVESGGGLELFAANRSPRQAEATVSLPDGADAVRAAVSVIGAEAGAQAKATAADGGTLTLVLGPWSTAVVTFNG